MKDDYCSVQELADELGYDRATLHSQVLHDIANGQNLENLNGILNGNRIKFSRAWLFEKKGIDLRRKKDESN
jgi:hypothetical protein